MRDIHWENSPTSLIRTWIMCGPSIVSNLQDYDVLSLYPLTRASNYLSNSVVSIESRKGTDSKLSDVLDRCQLFIDRQSFTFNASICTSHIASSRHIYVDI